MPWSVEGGGQLQGLGGTMAMRCKQVPIPMSMLLANKVGACFVHNNGACTHLNTLLCDFIHIQVFIDDQLTLQT
jgi:hypothetical protein